MFARTPEISTRTWRAPDPAHVLPTATSPPFVGPLPRRFRAATSRCRLRETSTCTWPRKLARNARRSDYRPLAHAESGAHCGISARRIPSLYYGIAHLPRACFAAPRSCSAILRARRRIPFRPAWGPAKSEWPRAEFQYKSAFPYLDARVRGRPGGGSRPKRIAEKRQLHPEKTKCGRRRGADLEAGRHRVC